MSADGGPFTPWLVNTTLTSGTFVGQCGHTYGFYSVARDNVGNVEATPAGAQVIAAACAEDVGFVPANKMVGKCEDGVAKSLGKLGTAIAVCHVKAGNAAFTGKSFAEDACHMAARAKFNAVTAKLSGCPSCLGSAQLASLADGLVATLDAGNSALYCAGTQPFGGDDAGFVPPTKAVLRCANAVAKNLVKLTACIAKCHVKAADDALKGTSFNEEACETTDPVKSCRAKYDKVAGHLGAAAICPACLDAAHQAALADGAEQSLDLSNGAVYCAGTTPFGSASGAFLGLE